MSARIEIPQEALVQFCRKWQIVEFALFGSVLRDDFRPDSDVDVLVQFAPSAEHRIIDLIHMEDDLRALFGRDVDLVTRKAVEQSRNYLRRKAILNAAEVVYAA